MSQSHLRMGFLAWLLIVVALSCIAVGSSILSLIASLLVGNPRIGFYCEMTTACVSGLTLVFCGQKIAAGRSTTQVSLVYWLLPMSISLALHRFQDLTSMPSLLLGLGLGTFFHTLGLHPVRRTNHKLVLRFALGAGVACTLIFGYASYRDFPAVKDGIPVRLSNSLEGSRIVPLAVYEYDLGGLIDHEWLWRIDGYAKGLSLLPKCLGLIQATSVPARFWHMPPHYWPRRLPPGAAIYESPGFAHETRGDDGEYYFCVIDSKNGHAYIWYKSNF